MGTLPAYKELERFYSDETDPIPKKFCKLNHFLKSTENALKSSTDAEKDNFIHSIEGDNDAFKRKVKLELADRLRRPGPILEALKSENTALIRRALKCQWIFQDGTASPLISDPEFICKEILSCISLFARRKVLNQLGKHCRKEDADKVTKIYENVVELYGSSLGKYLISGCNETVIESLIEQKRMKVRHSQLLNVYKKYPKLGMKYLHGLYQELINQDHSASHTWHTRFFTPRDACPFILNYVAKHDPQGFFDMFEKFEPIISPGLQFGRKLTGHLLQGDMKQRIMNKPSLYVKILNQGELKKRLSSEEFLAFVEQLFPENIQKFATSFEMGERDMPPLYSWFDKYPSPKKFEVLDSAFTKTYGKSILDYSEFISARVMQMLGPEQRDKWVDIRLEKVLTVDDGTGLLYTATGGFPIHLLGYWESFRPTEKSIPKIKQYLNTEPDIHKRGELLVSLVFTCILNKDMSSLKDVCQFVSSRYRNDNVHVRMEFLDALNNGLNLLKLDEDHWKPINELLHISSINNEFSFRLQLVESILEKSIHFRLLKNLPVDTQIQHFIKMKMRSYCRGESWCIATSDPIVEKKCLNLFTEHLTSAYPLSTPCPSDSVVTCGIISLFESYCGWNCRHRRKKLEILTATDSSWLMKRLQDVLDSYHEGNKQRIIKVMRYDPKTRSALLPRLFKSHAVPSVLNHFLQKYPKRLEEMIDEILDFMLGSNTIKQWKRFLGRFRNAGVPKLLELYGNRCLEVAEDEEESLKERSNAVYILSFLLDSKNFVDWASTYYPPEEKGKAEPYTVEELEAIYGIRKRIAESLSNLTTPSCGIPALKRLLIGDYTKLSVGSLYSIVQKSAPNPDTLIPFLKDLTNSGVSVKKHAIRLMVKISTKGESIEYLKALWEREAHYSIRTVLFNAIFQYFVDNNSEESWKLLITSLSSLNENDYPFLADLGRKEYIFSPGMPKDKLSEYLKMAVKKVDTILKSSPSDVLASLKWVKVELLQCIVPENVENIEESFLKGLFENHLFILKEEASFQSAIISVFLTYLFYHRKASEKKQLLGTYLERLVGTEWTNQAAESFMTYPARQSLSYFVEHLTVESFKVGRDVRLQAPQELKEMIQEVQSILRKRRKVSEFFVDDLFLSFTVLFHFNTPNNPEDLGFLREIGKDLGKLIDETISSHKPQVISVLSDSLKKFISLAYKPKLIRGSSGTSSEDSSEVIFIIDGILDSSGSLDTKIVASQLLQGAQCNVIRKGHRFEKPHHEIVKKLMDDEDETVQIFVSSRIIQRRQGRGYDYDILV